jgi:hypothetical protein
VRRLTVIAVVFLGLAARGLQSQDPKVRLRVWREAGPSEKSVDVLFVGDGYTKRQSGKFWRDVGRYAKRLLKEPPFLWYRDRFNVRAAFVPSRHSGCDLSPVANEVTTVLESHFDSPSGRLLTFRLGKRLHAIAKQCGQVDIIFVMVNTEKYGGAGTTLYEMTVRGRPCPAPTFAAQDTRSFIIAIHELGHSFATLADGYVDEAFARKRPLPADGKDLPYPNVTLAGEFDDASFEALRRTVKWGHFLDLPGAKKRKWVFEGGYFRAKGVFRPWPDCMMRTMGRPFCPICTEEMAKAILAACGEKWDDAAFHQKYPLRLWK